MSIYMTICTVVLAIWLVSILYVEWKAGLQNLFSDFYTALEEENDNEEDKEAKEAWDEMPESIRKGFAASVLLGLMPVIAYKMNKGD